ncbi:MAG TPA: UDP-N-acetylmuramoyl-L-alanyl-D-glutamate--2,6-diaminopimelate ligase [Papillibacter sp.]|jgi:UDP-N-acetylmuramoyl-L-alanyl-D-glutamate--2,6-diaminopimelate ligase|nr:UDP-N-acetylmuramoyl-L-alanyl-D-glutamate--2,6-diaminopimelate ligase [Papillibacter sp.]
MKLGELTAGLSILQYRADPDLDVKGVSYDSRQTQTGDVFVAIRGFETDGHRYIPQAVKAGASCVVCEEKPEIDVPYILVDNARRALAILSAAWFRHPAKELKIIGVTGTNGKTTTTHLIKSIIEECTGGMVGLIGTNANVFGDVEEEAARTSPESYDLQKLLRRMVDAGCKWVVMEVSSHALVLDRVYGIQYEVGVFTNLTQDHLDFHGTMEEYLRAKSLLFSQCDKGVINLDDPHAQYLMENAKCPVVTFSENDVNADIAAKRIKLSADRVEFCVLTIGLLLDVEVRIPSRFTVQNALAAITTAVQLGIDLQCIVGALKNCRGVKGRMEVVPTGREYTVIIDYAHTPDALEKVLISCRELTKGRLVCLFGCGGDRDPTKRPIMGEIATRLADFSIITSDNPRTEEPGRIIEDILKGVTAPKSCYTVIENRREAIAYALDTAQKDDLIVLAGKGHETYQIIGREKRHFDEREVIFEHLSRS